MIAMFRNMWCLSWIYANCSRSST